MATKTRIYYAEINGKKYLVDSSSPGQARTAVAKKHTIVRLATSSEVVRLMRSGEAEYLTVAEDPNTDIEDVTGSPAQA